MIVARLAVCGFVSVASWCLVALALSALAPGDQPVAGSRRASIFAAAYFAALLALVACALALEALSRMPD